MKRILQLTMLLAAACLTGCASTGGYFVDRGHDAADIFTATVGYGLGAKARVGPVNVGIYGGVDVAGLRCGYLMNDNSDGCEFTTPLPIFGANEWFDSGMHSFDAFTGRQNYGTGYKTELDLRGKDYSAEGYWVPCLNFSPDNAEYYTHIEVALGLGGTLRLGFNPGELLDFILGWFSIDIYNDDLERKKQKEKIEPKLELYQN